MLKIALLLLLVFAGSLLLVPRGVELASLFMRWGQVERARPLLEQAFAKGDRTAATIGWLARARAASGDVQGAIDLLRALIAVWPNDTAALELLASIYRAEPRPADYIAALLQLQERAPTLERQRELARMYGSDGSPALQSAALKTLIDRFDAAEVPEYLALAHLQAQQSRPALVLATLATMVERHPDSFDASVIAARLKALLDLGDGAAALASGRERLRAQPAALNVEAPMLASIFTAAGRPDLAVQLLEPHRADLQVGATLVAAWAQALSDSGEPGNALSGVLSFEAAREGGDADLTRLKLGLALAAGNLDVAVQAVNDQGIQEVPPDLLEGLASAALFAGRKDVLGLVRTASNALGASRPLLAARVAFALGDRPEALRWSHTAVAAVADDPADSIQLARLLWRMGEPRQAIAVLQVATPSAFDSGELAEYARLCMDLGYVANGLARIDALRLAHPSHAVDKAWALLAVADRRYSDVLGWLNSARGSAPSADLLRDLLHLSMDAKAYPLAIAAGQQLLRREPSNADRLLVANAMQASGRVADSVELYRTLKASGGVRDDTYVAALQAAWRAGAPVADELRRLVLHRLANDQSLKERESAIQTLVALGAHADVLPVLERMAQSNPARFLGLFTEVAIKARQPERLTALRTRLAEAGGTPLALRSQLAFQLLETGEKRSADRVFRELAANAAPDAEATQRLLFVWGPRPTSEQLDWLEARGTRSQRNERAAWMRLLIDRGAAERAVAVYKNTARDANSAEVRDVYLDAVVASGDKGAIAAAIRVAATHASNPQQWGRLTLLAANAESPALTRELLESAGAAGNAGPNLQRALGMLAWENRDVLLAERSLSSFNQRTGGDFETHRIVGDIHLKQGAAAAARRSYELALLAHERSDNSGFRARVAKAGLLRRLDRRGEARQSYESLLAERPNDTNLRADYVAFLLDAGESVKAKQLLAATR